MVTQIQAKPRFVEVVLDIASSELGEPFTYTVSGEIPAVGSRVMVPFGKRLVSGWVVGTRTDSNGLHDLKEIEEVYDDAPISGKVVALARWMSRRYACTLREALSTVSARAHNPSDRFAFAGPPKADDAHAVELYRRFKEKKFSALTAERALRAAKMALPLAHVRRKLQRLAVEGALQRVRPQMRACRHRTPPTTIAVLDDASKAKGAAQQRLAEVLANAGGSLAISDARKRAGVSAGTIRSATVSGMLRLHETVARTSGGGAPVSASFTPTSEQREAIDRLDAAMRTGPTTALLQGITGSGKTFVYSRLVDRVRQRGGKAIVLVPEIALTPQTSARFMASFGDKVGVLHSGLSSAQRAKVWEAAAQGELEVVVGARSAVFAPLPDVQLVIVDEEHEASYKQDVAPRYHATGVAMKRMADARGSVLLGSATPSLESYLEALEGRMLHVRLSERATAAPLPDVEIVDMTRQQGPGNRRALGPILTATIESCLARGEKALLFVNRRGYAGLLLCRACGFAPRCRRCAVSLVVHAADRSMRCHVCGDAFRIPDRCPKCCASDLRPFGFGTQRVEAEVRELFPQARVVRMDSDTTGAQGAHERLLTGFAQSGDILIGTQMIAKGLDYPAVTLVGVVAADQDLNRPDFRAAERTFALLTQVAGRAGRAAPGSRVVVQTYAPDHYAVALAAKHDYDSFAEKELALRRELRYPPFGRICYIIVAGINAVAVADGAAELASGLRGSPEVEILGPAPDVLPKARGEFRMRVALKSSGEDALLAACAWAQHVRLASGLRVTVIVDPR